MYAKKGMAMKRTRPAAMVLIVVAVPAVKADGDPRVLQAEGWRLNASKFSLLMRRGKY